MKITILQAVGKTPRKIFDQGDEIEIDEAAGRAWCDAGYAEVNDGKSKSRKIKPQDSATDASGDEGPGDEGAGEVLARRGPALG